MKQIKASVSYKISSIKSILKLIIDKMDKAGYANKAGVLTMVIFAFVGFIYGYLFIVGTSARSPFHEIVWNGRAVVDSMMISAYSNINKEADSVLQQKITAYNDTLVAHKILDSVKLGKAKDSISKKLDTTIRQSKQKVVDSLKNVLDRMSDSILNNQYFKNNFQIQANLLDTLRWNPDSGRFIPDNVLVTWRDASLPLKKVQAKMPLVKNAFNNSYYLFVSKYPTFGIWTVLLLLQVAFYFFLLPWLIYMVFLKDNPVVEYESRQSILYVSVIGAIVLTICIAFVFGPSKDGDFILPAYFMQNLHLMFIAISLPGYLASIFCFTGFLKCGTQLMLLKQNLTDVNKDATIKTMKELRQDFNNYFYCVAVILSLAVFATGTFFSGLNSLDIVQQISRSKGYNFLRYDFVYLYGLMHSFILLIFYLPTNFQFRKYAINEDEKTEAETPSVGAKGVASDLIKTLLKIAVASSPLLASLLQSLADHFFKS